LQGGIGPVVLQGRWLGPPHESGRDGRTDAALLGNPQRPVRASAMKPTPHGEVRSRNLQGR